jgi:hypothetical protein
MLIKFLKKIKAKYKKTGGTASSIFALLQKIHPLRPWGGSITRGIEIRKLFVLVCHYKNCAFLQFTNVYPKKWFFFSTARQPLGLQMPPHSRDFTIILRHTTLDGNLLDEWSARRRDLYLTTQNTHQRKTSMSPAKFEPAVPGSKRPHTYALEYIKLCLIERCKNCPWC